MTTPYQRPLGPGDELEHEHFVQLDKLLRKLEVAFSGDFVTSRSSDGRLFVSLRNRGTPIIPLVPAFTGRVHIGNTPVPISGAPDLWLVTDKQAMTATYNPGPEPNPWPPFQIWHWMPGTYGDIIDFQD